MKRTVLTQIQLELLERALVRFGPIVSSGELAEIIPDKSPGHRRKILKNLVDSGWLVRIKRGVYQIAEMSSLGTLSLSRLAIAQILLPNSYVSFEAALQYWGMVDQLLSTVSSVAQQAYYGPDRVEGTRYAFVRTTEAYFYGWQTVEIGQRQVQMAFAEKALIDMVQFHRSALSLSIVTEKLAEYKHRLDFPRLTAFLLRTNLTTLRIWGHLLEQSGHEVSALWQRSSESTSVSRLTPDSGSYDARWRLYFDPAWSDGHTQPHQGVMESIK